MVFKIFTAAAVAILTASIDAAPTPGLISTIVKEVIEAPQVLGGSTFKIPQVYNTGFTRSGSAALAKALSKYNAAIPPTVSGAISALTSSSSATTPGDTVKATPIDQFDSEYLCQVQIGTPPQTLNLDFDTGSSDLWVFSKETSSSEVNGQTLYDPFTSSTARNLTLSNGATWSISYADGSGSSGDVLTDTVSVGDVSVANQAVESARIVSSSFTATSSSSGLLGLAFNSINRATPKVTTFFSNAIPELASPLFTANLKKGVAGNYNFGFIDSTEHTSSISYVPVDNSAGFWGFTSSGYGVGSASFVAGSFAAIADTGTSLVLVPQAIVTAYYKQVTGAAFSSSAGGYIFPCDSSLPDFTFGAGSYRGVIPGNFINYSPSGSACFGGIQSNGELKFAIFGDIALKAQFVVFDYGNTRLGFASKDL